MVRTARPTTAIAGAMAAGLGGYGLLMAETMLTRRRIGTTGQRPPSADGLYGDELPGTPLRLLILGDSTAVGYGVERADETPAAVAAIGLSHLLDRPVDVRSEAIVGARSSQLGEQITLATDHRPDVAMIFVGANDVTHQIPPGVAGRQLARSVRRLSSQGTLVVVGTCPDLGTIKPMPPPLRQVARLYSRRLARAQTRYAVEAGARVVSIADMFEPLYLLHGDAMFGADRFHPSAAGYASAVGATVAAAAAGLRERESGRHDGAPSSHMSLSDAATAASELAGTEVVAEGSGAAVRPGPH